MPRRPDLARRVELAAAAFEVLRARGVHTSMRELADALGVKRPTLYFYFPDIGAVFESVLEQMYQALGESILARTRMFDYPLDRLQAVVDATIAFHRERPQLIGSLFQLWAVGGRDFAKLLERERKIVVAGRDALVADLRGGIARREVKPCDPERIVDLVLAVVDGVLVHHVLGVARPDGVIEELAARIIDPLRPEEEANQETSMTKPLWMARLAGSQVEMGAQHGRLVADDAARLVEFYRTMPERALMGSVTGFAGSVGRAAARGLAWAWQARLARERPAELAARSRAFMAAAFGDKADTTRVGLLTLATMDSMQNCVSLVARNKLGPFANPLAGRAAAAAAPACSTVIAWGDATADGELLFSRNFDFPGVGVWDAAPAFVVCAPAAGQRYGFFATRGADAPVVTVVNEAGLVMAPHTRWHTGVKFGGAMIVDLVHDIARRAESLADAVAIARERPVSSSWGIAIGSAREKSGLVLEIAGPTVEVVFPAPGASYHVCANRYRSPALQEGQIAGSAAWGIHSDRRERRLRALIDGRTEPLTLETLARFMGDRRDVDAPALRRHLGGILAQPTNVHCAVVAPAAQRALVGVDKAPCCEGTWAELAWTWEGPTGGWEIGATANSGFTARLRDDVVPAHDEATHHVHDAASTFESTHDVPTALAAIERAVAAEPDDPSLRLAAAWLAYAGRDYARAIEHVRVGLAHEHETYRRGQLLLWGSRAALRIDSQQSARWSDELARLSGPNVDELQAAARRRYRGHPHVNLMMVDAY